jgi:beta-N-acetylhexosaminidase
MTHRPGRLAATAILMVVVLVGCGDLGPTTAPSATATPGATGSAPTSTVAATETARETASPGITQPPDCAQSTLDALSLAQRVGQLFMVKDPTVAVGPALADAITTWHIGNVWYGRSTIGIAAIRSVSDALQALATPAATASVPLFIAANQEGGLIQGLSGPGFATIPSAVTQGSWSTDKLHAQAGMWGGNLNDAGVNVDFAPVADTVPAGTESQNAPIGQLQREYGSDPALVAVHVLAFMNGLHDAGVAATVKHFPGLGRVAGNTDTTAAVVDNITTRHDAYLEPFRAAIQEGQAEFVMASLATYTKIDPNNIAAFSPTVLQGMLRGDLGFDGVIMSDTLSATAVSSLTPAVRAVRFLEAGGDLIVLSPPVSTTIMMARAVTSRAATNATFRATVDAAALRVLEAKDEAGLLPCS